MASVDLMNAIGSMFGASISKNKKWITHANAELLTLESTGHYHP